MLIRNFFYSKVAAIVLISLSTLSHATQATPPPSEALTKKDHELTDAEISLIEAKRKALLYQLLEEEETMPLLMEMLRKKYDQEAETQIIRTSPYTADQIKRLRQGEDSVEKAVNKPLYNTRVEISEIDYDPNSNTHIPINVAANNPSSIAFFDYQGNPWPIVGDVIGDSAAFESHPFSESNNTAVFVIKEKFAETVALLNLKGIDQLVVVRLIGNEEVFDARKNVRIPMRGPLSKDTVDIADTNPSSSDPILIKLLNGERIDGGETYNSNINDDSVFIRLGNKLYVRTRNKVTFPPSESSQVSSNGYNLYRLSFGNTLVINKDGQEKIISLTKERNYR